MMKKTMAARKTREGYVFIIPAVVYLLLVVGYPLVYNFVLSFKDVNVKNLSSGTSRFIGFQNYMELFQDPTFLLVFRNTIIFTIACLIFQFTIGFLFAMFFSKKFTLAGPIRGLILIGYMMPMSVTGMIGQNIFANDGFITMAITLILGVPAAYGMGRYQVKGRNGFLLIFLVTQMLPASLMLTPMYLVFSKMGLLGTHFSAPIAIAAGSIPFAVITLRPYFRSVPISLDEAARVDGCGPYRAFFQIMIPTVKTGIITIVVISFLNGWNDLLYSMTFNTQASMRPLTANIYKFQSKYGTKWNCIMAYGSILALPVIIMFIFLQKYIVGGMTAGAVKE